MQTGVPTCAMCGGQRDYCSSCGGTQAGALYGTAALRGALGGDRRAGARGALAALAEGHL